MTRVTNKMIADRLLEKGISADEVRGTDMENAYHDLREEIGNPIKTWANQGHRGWSSNYINDDRADAIWEMMK